VDPATGRAAVGSPPVPPPSGQAPISDALAQALAKAIATVPPDRRGALTLSLSRAGAQVEAAHRLATNWTVAGYGAYWWQSGATEVGVQVKGSW